MEPKPEYHTDDGRSKTPKTYKPVWLHFEIHERVRLLAKRLGVTMIELIDMLVKEAEGND